MQGQALDAFVGRIDRPTVVLVVVEPRLRDEIESLLCRSIPPHGLCFIDSTTTPLTSLPFNVSGCVIFFDTCSLGDERFREWLKWCVRMERGPAFRVFSATPVDAETLKGDALLASLMDRAQRFKDVDSMKDLATAVRFHLVTGVEEQQYARFRRLSLAVTSTVAGLATLAQVIFICTVLLGMTAELTTSLRGALEGWPWRAAVGFAGGALVFPLWSAIWLIVTVGRREGSLAGLSGPARVIVRFTIMRWLFRVTLGVLGIWWVTTRPGVPLAWCWAGLATGAIVDLARRSKFEVLRRQICALVDRTRPGVAVEAISVPWSSVQLAPLLATPLMLPLYRMSPIRAFISYTEQSPWSKSTALLLHDRLKTRGVESFCAELDISVGRVWRDEIDRALAQADIVVSVADAGAAARMWPNAELRAAIESRLATGAPALLVLAERDWIRSEHESDLPAFQCAREGWTEASGARNVCDAAILAVDDVEESVAGIASWLSRYERSTVLGAEARVVAILLTPIAVLVSIGATLVAQAGVFGLLSVLAKVPISVWLESKLPPGATLLLLAFLFGSSLRLGIGWRFEAARTRTFRRFSHSAFAGAVALALLLKPMLLAASTLQVHWALVAAALGWWRAAAHLTLFQEWSPKSMRRTTEA